MSRPSRQVSSIHSELLLESLHGFYAKPQNMAVVRGLLRGEAGISLRLIDFFVTCYAKRHNVVITRQRKQEHVNVYLAYRAQLRSFTKRMFDPFRRQDRIAFNGVTTTIAQLNFLKWLITNDILDYIKANSEAISRDMDAHTSKKCDAEPEARPDRSPYLNMSLMKNACVLTFD